MVGEEPDRQREPEQHVHDDARGERELRLHAAFRELAESRADAAPGEWEKILIMGKQLAPEDPLFSGGGAVTGA